MGIETYSSYLRAPIFDTLNVANPIIHSFFTAGPGGFSSPHDMIKVCSLERVSGLGPPGKSSPPNIW